MVKAIQDYRSPRHKIIAMLKKGRDDLRVKYRELMEQRRTAENQVRAVEKSRSMWRARAEAAESELHELKKPRQKNLWVEFPGGGAFESCSFVVRGVLNRHETWMSDYLLVSGGPKLPLKRDN